MNPIFQNPVASCKIPKWSYDRAESAKIYKRGAEAFFVYGRYQPGHKGHTIVFEKLIEAALDTKPAGEQWVDINGNPASNIFVFTSPKVNPPPESFIKPKRPCSKRDIKDKRCENPLMSEQKVTLLKKQNADTNPPINFVNMETTYITKRNEQGDYVKIRTPIAAILLLLRCYKKVVMYVGSDRVEAMSILKRYFPGQLEIRNAGERDPDSGDIDGMSSSKIRQAIINMENKTDPNFQLIKKNLQFGDVDSNLLDDIINQIRYAYGQEGLKYGMESDIAGGKRKRRKQTKKRKKNKRKPKTKTKRRKTIKYKRKK